MTQAKSNAQAIAALPDLVAAVRKAAQYTALPLNSADMRWAVRKLCEIALRKAGVAE